MKKVFTLMLSGILFTSAFAQYDPGYKKDRGNDKKNDVVINNDRRGDNHYNNGYAFRKREIEIKLNRINREYDQKIEEVKCRVFMSRVRKSRMIARLENERREEIRKVYAGSKGRRF